MHDATRAFSRASAPACLSLTTFFAVAAVCLLLTTSIPIATIDVALPPDPLGGTAEPEDPPGSDIPPAPPWPSLQEPGTPTDPGNTSSPDWNAFVRGPTYLENLSVPYPTARFYSNMSKAFPWTDADWARLRDNGFVVFPTPDEHDIELMYRYYWVNDLPVFITTDTVLHAHHLLFDQMFQDVENASLRPMVENMSAELLAGAVRLRASLPPALSAAGTDAVVFFAVPNVLLATGKTIPADVKARVDGIVKKILAADGIEFVAFWDGVQEYVDWSQYKPRGHYDRSEHLKRYFRAMMWFGRASFTVTEPTGVVPASVVSAVVDGSPRGFALWTRVYNSTARLVGESDSLNHLDVRRAFVKLFGSLDVRVLAGPENVTALAREFASDEYYRQKILSTVLYADPGRAANGTPVEFPKIYQFMGQRYVLDSEVMQSVMFDRVPLFNGARRGLPSGLDVAAALGSPRAVDWLRDELATYNYTEELRGQWEAVRNKSEGFWNRTAYSRHLSAFREVLAPPPEGAPGFARTRAWATEKINTALGSWAELRHDTILYAKQPYSIGITCSTPTGWVEPYPAFFRRMAWLSREIVAILADHFDPALEPVARFTAVYREFGDLTDRLAGIAQHELDGLALTPIEVDFIRGIFVKSVTDGYGFVIANYGWLPDLLRRAKVTDKTRDARIVADIATDPGDPLSSPRVLHVGLAAFRHVVVAYRTPDGDWHLAVGPVYGYNEFAVPGFTRLTDDEWKTRLGTDPPPLPAWTRDFMAP